MRLASRLFGLLLASSVFGLVVACVGGPGQLPDDQGGTGGPGNTTSTTTSPPTNSGSGSGTTTGTGGSTGSSGSSGTTAVKRTIAANEFDQSCTDDLANQCAAVFVGTTCNPCQCPNAAIKQTDLSKYQATLKERSVGCPQQDVACEPCQQPTAFCSASRCAISFDVPDGG